MLATSRRLPRLPAILLLLGVAFVSIFVTAQSASAHPVGTTGVFLTVQSDAVEVKMQLQMDGFIAATNLDVTGDQEALDEVSDRLMTFVTSRVRLHDEQSELKPNVIERPTLTTVNDQEAVETVLRFDDGGRALDGKLTLDYNFILDIVPAHQVYVALISDWEDGHITEGDPEVVGVLGGGKTQLVLDRSDRSPVAGFGATVYLGMLHIAEGTDHLLFLTTLLIVAPSLARRARRGWRWTQPIPLKTTLKRALLVVTAFTGGHLITLALVSLGLISFPTKPVEILVAVSIVVAGIHAIKPLMPRGEVLIAGVFGLVHGTAFATTILDLNLAFGEKLWAILGFNVGVELAQLIAAALVLPLLILLSHASAFAPFRVVVAIFAIVSAGAWILGITTDSDTVLQPLFDAIAAFPIPFYLGLVAFVVALWYVTRLPKADAVASEQPEKAPQLT